MFFFGSVPTNDDKDNKDDKDYKFVPTSLVSNVDCITSDWQTDGACIKASNNNYYQPEKRIILTNPIGTGTQCPTNITRTTMTCGSTKQDCVLDNDWTATGGCTLTTGGVYKQSYIKNIIMNPSGPGALACGLTSKTETCTPTPGDCVMNDWGAYGDCKTDNNKYYYKSRTRTVKTPAVGTGKPCGTTSETEQCNPPKQIWYCYDGNNITGNPISNLNLIKMTDSTWTNNEAGATNACNAGYGGAVCSNNACKASTTPPDSRKIVDWQCYDAWSNKTGFIPVTALISNNQYTNDVAGATKACNDKFYGAWCKGTDASGNVCRVKSTQGSQIFFKDNPSKCLVVNNGNSSMYTGSTGNDNTLGLWNCDPNDKNQRFIYNDIDREGKGLVQWDGTNKCLMLNNGNNNHGIILAECNKADDNQKWNKVSDGNSIGQFKRNGWGKCMTLQGGDVTKNIVSYECSDAGSNHKWKSDLF